MTDDECVTFLQWAAPRLGLRWAGFRKVRKQVGKRIARRMTDLGLKQVEQYREYLRDHPAEWLKLDRMCRITVSRFFRDRAVIERIRTDILPTLIEKIQKSDGNRLDIWSVGCGSGEEPYSLALIWESSARVPAIDARIIGSDADLHLLHRARDARYAASSLRELPGEWRDRAFVRQNDEYALREEYKRPVRFVCHDIRSEPLRGPFHLILCRNLAFTYFDEARQREVAQRLGSVLVPGGYVIVGTHESLPSGQTTPIPIAAGIYQFPSP